MELLRSLEMRYVRLLLPLEDAQATLLRLGVALKCLQFTDLRPHAPSFGRPHAGEVRKCEGLLRALGYLKEQMEAEGVMAQAMPTADEAPLVHVANEIGTAESELRELTANWDALKKQQASLVEFQIVIEQAGSFFGTDVDASALAPPTSAADVDTPLLASGSGRSSPDVELQDMVPPTRLGFVAGVVNSERVPGFERMLFRATRGNVFLRQAPIDGALVDPATGERTRKTAFVVFFAGSNARDKVGRICEAFGANRYPLPEQVAEQRNAHAELTVRLRELHVTLTASERLRAEALRAIGARHAAWTEKVRREKAAFDVLNLCTVSGHFVQAKAWCPAKSVSHVQQVAAMSSRGSVLRTIVEVVDHRDEPAERARGPPTHFETNDATGCFQEIVNAYGVARYREVNPTVFTIVTFPFLFAVMFGDVGHGMILLLVASYLILREDEWKRRPLGEMEGMLFAGRYCLFLMSLFSIYMGFLYNEIFSMPMTAFGDTRFVCPTSDGHMLAAIQKNVSLRIARADHSCPNATKTGLVLQGSPYPFGLDPVWHETATELSYTNSLKMKMSVVMGVVQMSLGICLSYLNHTARGDALSVWCDFVPQILFLTSSFGYLSLMIVTKWVTGSVADLYHLIIYLFLDPGGAIEPENRLFPGQEALQGFLLLVILVCVPWMFFVKPYVLWQRRKRRSAAYERLEDEGDGGGDEEQDFTDVVVHQAIHTIEFVLGAVSNTASYLRLWALSLAHSQLSTVFFQLTIMAGLQMNNPYVLFVAAAVWGVATIAVLLVMEGLSAFLHALRLHWVEFQNKFYAADGWRFEPHFSGL